MATSLAVVESDLPENADINSTFEDSETECEIELRSIPEDLVDVELVVEGRQLHANRSVLAHYSPVFHKMFFSDFKEKGQASIPLPEEKYEEMATFLNVLYPRTLASEELISDENLLQLLTLAEKYIIEEVKFRCQEYIGTQLMDYLRHFLYGNSNITDLVPESGEFSKTRRGRHDLPLPIYDPRVQHLQKSAVVHKLSLYMRACEDYSLGRYREEVKSMLLALCCGMADLSRAEHYGFFSPILKVELLESMCHRLD